MVLRVLASLFHVFYESGPRESTTKCFAAFLYTKTSKGWEMPIMSRFEAFKSSQLQV